jgi:hypothetical protein
MEVYVSHPLIRWAAYRHRETKQVVETGAIHDPDFLPGKLTTAQYLDPEKRGWEAGFTSHGGEFLTREEAARLVRHPGSLLDTAFIRLE